MNGPTNIGIELRSYFRAVADDQPVPGALDAVLNRTMHVRPRRRPFAWLDETGETVLRRVDIRRLRLVIALAALIAMALVALLTLGADRTRHAGLVVFSHDGTAYVVGPGGGSPTAILGASRGRLYVVPAAAWSADGRLLAVDQDRDASVDTTDVPDAAVVMVDPVTRDAREVGLGSFVGWAGDEAILRGDTQVRAVDVVARTTRVISSSVDGALALSPDGRWLAMTGLGGLRRIDTRTGERVTLLENPSELIDVAAWSPDSMWISVARTLGPQCHMCVGPLVRLRVDGSRMETISFQGENAWHSSWAPSGEWIVYQSRDALVVSRPDASERRTLVEGQDPTWTPDGRGIRFQGVTALDDTFTRYPLFEIELGTGEVHRLDDGSGVDGYAGQSLPEGVSVPLLGSSRDPSGQ